MRPSGVRRRIFWERCPLRGRYIEPYVEDFLGALSTARAIHRTIRSAPSSWSTRIGLYGAWGSGKTSILNLLEQLEKAENSVIVRFSAWSALGEAGVLRLFYEELSKQLKKERVDLPIFSHAKQLAAKSKKFGLVAKIFGRSAEVAGQLPPGTSDAVAEVAESAFAWLAIDRKDIDALVKKLSGRRVVVFIDDLDRADPRLIPKTLLALRELLDWPGFSFVLAFDRRVVAQAIREYSTAYGDNAQTFLEKVIDVPFEVTTPSESQKAALALHAFNTCCPFVPTDALAAAKAYFPDEPRRIKLIARKIGVLASVAKRHGPEELDWFALLLHQIIHEASPEAATHAMQVSTGQEVNWLLWAGGDEERQAREREVRSALALLISDPTTLSSHRVVSAAMALINHWAHRDADHIRYLVNLAFDEPTFTRQEFGSTLEDWLKNKDDAMLTRATGLAAEYGSVRSDLAARDFLLLAITRYSETLQHIADVETESARLGLAKDAEQILSFLEHLWTATIAIEIRAAAKSGAVSRSLVSAISQWIGWSKNVGEEALRQREQALALAVAIGSDDQEGIYCDTDPFFNARHRHTTPDVLDWLAQIRSTLNEPICERLFARFDSPGELQRVIGADEELATWLLESRKSPIYENAGLAEKLVQKFVVSGDDGDASSQTLRDNVKIYLHMLLNQARSATWGGSERVREIHALFPQMVPAAWDVVAKHRVPFRMVSSILKLRSDLVSAGIPEDALKQPTWMTSAAAELQKIQSAP
jgi:KAP family P-loop domain